MVSTSVDLASLETDQTIIEARIYFRSPGIPAEHRRMGFRVPISAKFLSNEPDGAAEFLAKEVERYASLIIRDNVQGDQIRMGMRDEFEAMLPQLGREIRSSVGYASDLLGKAKV